MLSPNDILRALEACYDPSLPCNIVDLGLVRTLSVTPDPDAPGAGIPGVPSRHIVSVTLTVTNFSSEAEAQLAAQVKNRLAGLESVSRTELLFEHQPPWSPADITPAGRRTLGLEGNRTLVQIRPA